MATTPTNLSVPSESPRDLKFNAGKIDEFVTSLALQYIDRFGNAHYTIEGLRWMAQQAISQYGWVPIGTFQDGATLTLPNQILKDTTDGEYYRWDGSFLPSGKVVPNGSTPGSTGGVGVGAWISVGDSALRSMLASEQGVSMVGGIAMELDSQADLATNTTVQGRLVAVKNTVGSYNKYSIIPNSGVLGDGDVIIDRVDGLQAELQIEGVLDVRAFAKSGRTDQQIIQAELDYAGSKSGHWVVGLTAKDKTGTPWRFSTLNVPDSTVFQGHGGALKLNDNVCVDASVSYYLLHNINGNDVWLDGLYIDGNMSNNSLFTVADLVTLIGEGSKITNCTLMNAPDSGLMFSGVKNGLASANTIGNGRDVAIYANASADGSARNNVLSDNVLYGFPAGGIGFKRYFADCVASGNAIYLCGNGVTFEDFTVETEGKFPKRITLSGTFMRDIGFPHRATANVAERGISIQRASDISITGLQTVNVSGNILYIGNGTDICVDNAMLRGYVASPQSNGNNGVLVVNAQGGHLSNVNVTAVASRAGYFQTVNGMSVRGGRWVSSGTQSGIRVDATAQFSIFNPDYISGGSGADEEWFEGATGISNGYIRANATGPGRYGIRELSAGQGTNPNTRLIPRFIGEKCVTLSDSAIWMAKGMSNSDWVKLSN
ncbi:hypothetical protein AUQ18_09000 [Escherichia coli]|uniref:tail fiber/spike domain-containing protein n=1 Tax=Escherichia coli TaxID=562 RepID=UPI000774F748|nr:right-handed parallel beta-helix repeat-containing protein [Escherichia coli]KXQ82766.1 hypothetical protein AUQ18_09000 [Escherichia coli]